MTEITDEQILALARPRLREETLTLARDGLATYEVASLTLEFVREHPSPFWLHLPPEVEPVGGRTILRTVTLGDPSVTLDVGPSPTPETEDSTAWRDHSPAIRLPDWVRDETLVDVRLRDGTLLMSERADALDWTDCDESSVASWRLHPSEFVADAAFDEPHPADAQWRDHDPEAGLAPEAVGGHTIVDVRLRNGVVVRQRPAHAVAWGLRSRTDRPFEVVAWRRSPR